jgi:hypothetical protein
MSNQDPDNLFQAIFNAMPLPLFRVTREVEILDLNRAAQKIFHAAPSLALKKRGGDLMHCINALGAPGGCGHAKACVDCLIRNSVRQVFETGREISRRRSTAQVVEDDKGVVLDLLITVSPLHFGGEMSALLCLEDISELTSMQAMIPICASCKKIRDDRQLWSSVESYFSRFPGVAFSHGICPECAQRLYPDLYHKVMK